MVIVGIETGQCIFPKSDQSKFACVCAVYDSVTEILDFQETATHDHDAQYTSPVSGVR